MSQHNITSVSVCGGQSKVAVFSGQNHLVLDPMNTWFYFGAGWWRQ